MNGRDRLWRNWAGNQQCVPARVAHPATEDELVRIVENAAAAGQRLKVVGSGHSFTGIALTDGWLVKLDRYNAILAVDSERRTVTVQAGIRLSRLNEELWARGLALPNVGDVDYQTVAGDLGGEAAQLYARAVGAGRDRAGYHGTGVKLGGLATQVAGLRLIAADGSAIDCSPESEADVFAAARVGLGALGVISTVTLQCEPAFNLRAVEMPMRVDEALESLDEHVSDNDHFEFFWVPHSGWALTKRNNRSQDSPRPRSWWQEFRDDVLVSNVAFGAVCRIGRLRPDLIPRLGRALPNPGRVEYVDRSYRVFTSPRFVRFYEMEYAIPIEAAAEAVNRVRAYVQRSGLTISFPVEVRFVAGDDIPLSTSSGRDSCYIAVHVYEGTQYQQYFEAVEDIMDDYGGRPHWGKLHFQTAETLAPRYPAWDRFQDVRARLDPGGVFANPYLDRVLGPPTG